MKDKRYDRVMYVGGVICYGGYITFHVDPKYRRFRATIALSDDSDRSGEVVFKVFVGDVNKVDLPITSGMIQEAKPRGWGQIGAGSARTGNAGGRSAFRLRGSAISSPDLAAVHRPSAASRASVRALSLFSNRDLPRLAEPPGKAGTIGGCWLPFP
jgi:hypothetical protein